MKSLEAQGRAWLEISLLMLICVGCVCLPSFVSLWEN
jgi:hypothetical protein